MSLPAEKLAQLNKLGFFIPGMGNTNASSEVIVSMNSVSQNSSLYKILSSLRNVKPCGNGWQALCPAHDDRKPSLKIDIGKDGRILLKCFAGCETEDIVKAIGLEMSNLFPSGDDEKTPKRQVAAVYNYRDENGNLLYQVCRTEPKGFFQRRPDGRGGWVKGLGDVKPVLYRLPELLQAVQSGETVFIPEGEKDVDNLARLGLAATTNPMGAGKWRPEFSDYLKNAEVIILPDADEAGRKHAQQVAQSLHGKAASVKVLELPDLPAKGDVSDWLAAGGTREELLRLVAETPEWKPPKPANCFTAAELLRMEFPDPVWCVSGILPEGLTILAGKPKIGKSWMALNLAVAVASGGVFLGESVNPAQVLYFALEDTPRRLKDRLLSVLSGDPAPERLYLYTGLPKLDDGGLVLLEAEIIKRKPKLVIIDTLQRIRGVHKGNSTAYQVDYEEIAGLKQIADRHGVALVLIHHLKKAAEVDPLDMVSGSVGISGAADAVWVLTRERGQADATLYAVGRDFEERELALRLDPTITTWQLLGDAEEYRMSKERREILGVLREAEKPLTPKEVAEILDRPHGSVKKLLYLMSKDGLVKTLGRGKYTVTDSKVTGNFGNHGNFGNFGNHGNLAEKLPESYRSYRESYRDETPQTLEPQGIVTKVTEVTGYRKENGSQLNEEIVKDNYGKYSCPSCPSSPSSPTCPSCPSSTEMNPKIGLGHELGQQLGHPSDPQTRINTELGQDGQLGHMDSNLNVQPDGLGHPNESGVQTWDDPDDGKLPREVFDI